MEEHVVIIVPGLGEAERFGFLTRHWRTYGIETIHHRVGWYDGERFDTKLEKILARIDASFTEGKKVSLIGCSAGGSAALNAFLERKEKIHRVVNLCGWINTGEHRAYLERWRSASRSFVESVLLFDARKHELTPEDRRKIMTARAIFDELVPADATMLAGVRSITLPVPEHTLAIISGLTIFSRQLIDFIRIPG